MNDKELLQLAIEALSLYADEDSYSAISFHSDPPCGEFADDFYGSEEYNRLMPGKRARDTLRQIVDETIKNQENVK